MRFRPLAIGLAALFLPSVAFADFNPFLGVTYSHVEYTQGGFPVAYDLVDIDLTAPGISFLVSAPNGDARPLDVDRATTREFVTSVGAQIGINASFFGPSGDQYVSGDPADAIGLAASQGVKYSDWLPAWNSVNIAADNTVTFLDADPGMNVYNAVAGTFRLVRDGIPYFSPNLGNGDERPDARTALAIDNRGHLLLLTVDGRNLNHSIGLNINQLAALLAGPLHAIQAINLDGGGSTTLVMADQGAPRVVNVPVGLGFTPGTERPVATSLAIFARAIPEPGSWTLILIGGATAALVARRRPS